MLGGSARMTAEMLRRRAGAALGAVLGGLVAAAGALAGEMAFENLCSGNFPESCRIRVAGEIGGATPDAFRRYLAEAEPEGGVVLLDGSGGDLEAGLAFGRLLRDLGFETEVGLWAADGGRGDVAPGARCADACAYAFLGGVARRAPPGNALVFRAVEPGAAAARPARAAALVRYLREMGVDPRLFALISTSGASLTPDAAALEAFAVVTPTGFGPFLLEPDPAGIVAVSRRRGVVRARDLATALAGGCREGRPVLRLTADLSLPEGYLPEGRITLFGDGAPQEVEFAGAAARRASEETYELALDPALAAALARADAFELRLMLLMIDGGGLHGRFELSDLDRKVLATSFLTCAR